MASKSSDMYGREFLSSKIGKVTNGSYNTKKITLVDFMNNSNVKECQNKNIYEGERHHPDISKYYVKDKEYQKNRNRSKKYYNNNNKGYKNFQVNNKNIDERQQYAKEKYKNECINRDFFAFMSTMESQFYNNCNNINTVSKNPDELPMHKILNLKYDSKYNNPVFIPFFLRKPSVEAMIAMDHVINGNALFSQPKYS
uniref:Unspecified product n=1 Tax=Parastrongyloides trichosuri TaxID=131310 RepID=A0A0N4ZQE0_PARTI